MSEGLGNFLIDLASNPEQAARFLVSPHSAIAHFTLSAEERRALIDRDPYRLRRLLLAKEENGNGGVAGGGNGDGEGDHRGGGGGGVAGGGGGGVAGRRIYKRPKPSKRKKPSRKPSRKSARKPSRPAKRRR